MEIIAFTAFACGVPHKYFNKEKYENVLPFHSRNMAKHNGYVGYILMTYEGVEMTGIKFPFGYITRNYAKKMRISNSK